MISVRIGGNVVEIASQLRLRLNRKEEADNGNFVVLNGREERYSPYTIVDITWDTKDYQMLIESDNVIKQNSTLYEHNITLIEPMAILSTIFPADRSFTDVPLKTLGEILEIYKKELLYFHDFRLVIANTILPYYDKVIFEREYSSVDMAVIIYDLFRTFDAIPRLKYNNNIWILSAELYTERNNELTITTEENRETQVNDIDYATSVIHKSRNATIEQKAIWWPSKNKWALPTFKGDIYKTSDIQYELDSDILKIEQVLGMANVTIIHNVDGDTDLFIDDLEVDITDSVFEEEVYESLLINDETNPDWQWDEFSDRSPENHYKQIAIKYSINNNTIDGLFYKNDNVLFDRNVTSLLNVLNAYIRLEAIKKYPELDIREVQLRDDKTENIKLRVKYRPSRDVDFAVERQDTSKFNKSSILNNQRDSKAELTRLIRNADIFVNRIGNETINITQSKEYWELGDYVVIDDEYWLITDITYNFDKNNCVISNEFTRNFANINRETSIARLPSPYVYTGKRLQSNFIIKEYIIFDTETDSDDSDLNDFLKNVAINIFDYNSTYNTPLTNAFINDTSRIELDDLGRKRLINAPLLTGGSGNLILAHLAMRDPRVAGNSSIEYRNSYYKKPILYTRSDFTVENLYLTFAKDYIEDGRDYPSVYVDESDELLNYTMPINKDPNDTLAITWELLVKSKSKNIIVCNGFAKYNNLVNEFELEPELKLYSRSAPYDKLETTLTDADVEIDKQYSYLNRTTNTLVIQDELDNAIEYWALAYDNELILCGNNNVKEINIIFKNEVDYKDYVEPEIDVVDYTISPVIFINSNLTENITQFESYRVRPVIEIDSSVAETITKIEFVRNTVQPAIIIDSDISEQVSAIVYINTVVQPTIELGTSITEQVSAVEYVDVVVQPIIDLNTNVNEQASSYVYVRNQVQPIIELDTNINEQVSSIIYVNNQVQVTIVIDSDVTENITRPIFGLQELATAPTTVDLDVNDLGYINTFDSSVQETIEQEWGMLELYSIGTTCSINKGYIERIGVDTPEFTLTVSGGDLRNYSAILSAMQTQETQYYNDMVADDIPTETIFKVDDGLSVAYYKILLVSNRKNYYEIIDTII
jgi:hypothetical protein